jgi:hypothetical protein
VSGETPSGGAARVKRHDLALQKTHYCAAGNSEPIADDTKVKPACGAMQKTLCVTAASLKGAVVIMIGTVPKSTSGIECIN